MKNFIIISIIAIIVVSAIRKHVAHLWIDRIPQKSIPWPLASQPLPTISSDQSSGDECNSIYTQDEIIALEIQAAIKYGINPFIVVTLGKIESNHDQSARSSAGAVGALQLMESTADFLNSDPYCVNQNIDAGVRYLKMMLLRYDSNVTLALASYNAGPGAVDRYNGVPDYRETREFLNRFMSEYQRYHTRFNGSQEKLILHYCRNG